MKKLAFYLSILYISVGAVFGTENPPIGCPTIAVTGSPVSCYSGSNGSVNLSISTGSGNYTINWSSGETGVLLLTNKPAGTYTVNVKDNVSGCTVFGSFVVNQPSAIVLSNTVTNLNCKSVSTGQVDLTVNGGVPPYTYDWNNDGPGFTANQDITNIPAGSYNVTVRDNNLCTSNISMIVTEPAAALQSSETHVDVSCFATSTGSIDLTAWGGTFPYTYVWSTGANSQDISNLSANNYSCLITDFKGCTRTQNVTITQPTAVAASVFPTAVLCNGGSTGSISSNVSGGTPPYNYSWQNSTNLFSSNSSVLSNVVADNYQLTVTDSKGCFTTASGIITQPSKLILSATSVNVSCNGGTDGSINLLPTGGVSPYSFSWTNDIPTLVSTNEDLTNIPAQTYTVVVTDNNNCTETLTRTVTQPLLPLTATHTFVNVNCFGNSTGSIDVTPVGGTNPLNFSWTNGASTEDIINLAANTYGYTITDAKNCSFSSTVVITQPLAPLTSAEVLTNVNCFGESNGAIDFTMFGGTSPYSYAWENSSYLMSNTTQDLTNIPQDAYQVTVTDAKGCILVDNFVITEPPLLTSTISGVDILCFNGTNGSIDLEVNGGTPGYTYSWSNGSSTQDLTNLGVGTYSVDVFDINNCTTTNEITLTGPSDSLSYTFEVEHVKCNNGFDGELTVTINGGTVPYDYLWSNGATTFAAQNLIAGDYGFLITDANGCLLSDTLTVTQPDPIVMNEVITPVTCFGLTNGIIDISPVGGTAPYQYTWFNSDFALSTQTQDLVNFPSDTFQLEMTDTNGCFYEMFWFIPQPQLLEASFTSDNVNCAGGTDGSILVDVVGGNGVNVFAWSNGATTEDIINVPVGIYSFMVTDSLGCQDSLSVQIFEPEPVAATFLVVPVECKDQYNGELTAYGNGGIGNYTYEWGIGSTDQYINGLATNTYSIHIEDVLGCSVDTFAFVPKLNEFCIFPPNTFTPNGDDYNDTWVIDNIDVYQDLHFQLFNKWGNLVYESKGLYQPWDGKVGGVTVPSDTYYYLLYLNNADQDKIDGSIIVIR
jgi:gliding motility-associated-like protein